MATTSTSRAVDSDQGDPAVASSEIFTHIIDGKSYNQSNAQLLNILNPANDEIVAKVPIADQAVVDLAVQAARRAFVEGVWSKRSWEEREAIIYQWWKETFHPMVEDLIPLFVAEQGRSPELARMELTTFVDEFFQCDAWPKMQALEVIDAERGHYSRTYPLGVWIALVPWNFPIVLMLWKVISALLTGNCIIVKPSTYTPLVTIKIIKAAQRHFPPGVLQVIVGDDSLGPLLTRHPDIDGITFTGSSEIGRRILTSATPLLKRVNLELGGNDAAIVLPLVKNDPGRLEDVAHQVFLASMLNAGQFCAAAKRVYVHASVYDDFARLYTDIVVKAADSLGPLTTPMQYAKAKEFLEEIHSRGYKTLTGGFLPKDNSKAAAVGHFMPATVVDRPPEDSAIVQSEQFCAIVPLLEWSDEADLLKRVNASDYGLAATIWGSSDDMEMAHRLADGIECGTVWINQLQSFDPKSSFEGWKQSGLGGGALGRRGLEGYMRFKTIKTAPHSLG